MRWNPGGIHVWLALGLALFSANALGQETAASGKTGQDAGIQAFGAAQPETGGIQWLSSSPQLAQGDAQPGKPSAAPVAMPFTNAFDDEGEPSAQPPAKAAKKADKSELPPPAGLPWEVKFMVYGWLPALDGHAGAKGRSSDVDVDLCDSLHALKDLECLVPFDLETRVGNWGLDINLLYARLEDSKRVGPVKVDLVGEQTILELTGFYRLGTWPAGGGGHSSVSVDVLGGARYNHLEGNVGLALRQRAISLGGSQQWWDPLVGSRVNWQATDKLSLFVRGDVGGFGIEGCSHIAWQVIGAVQYDFTRNILLQLGYRLLDDDFTSGAGRHRFTYDVLMAGPYLGLGVKF